MKKFDTICDMIPSKFGVCSLVFFLLLVPITAAFPSSDSSISEVQRLLSLTNLSLMRGDLDSSLESLNEALNIVQELNEDEENNSDGNDLSNRLEDETGNDDNSNDGSAIGANIIDDNVERSQECIENTRPGEVCALS